MSFAISKIILHNRAPFEHLEIDFSQKGISVLTAVNGGGKTTILSHIVDAWYEIVRIGFPQEFEGKENKYYRLSSALYNLVNSKPSVVYIRFLNDGKNLDYIDVRGKITQIEYDNVILLSGKIQYSQFSQALEQSNNAKHISIADKVVQKIFQENIITSFPAYRYEEPGYLNDPFQFEMDYKMHSNFSGYLNNPIEVVSGLPKLANWIMDIMLDRNLNKKIQTVQLPDNIQIPGFDKTQRIIQIDVTPENVTISSLNQLIQNTLVSKPKKGTARLGIGPRYSGGTRISIMNDHQNVSKQYYPTIFNLSSGEQAIFSLFGELIRQIDIIKPNQAITQASGIVLIDEVDKHLHIRLQKEVLPQLFALFPNIQFIISSHSPFVSMGLFDNPSTKTRLEVIDLDRGGVKSSSEDSQVFSEGYEAMMGENARFKTLYETIKSKAHSDKLQILSEGKNYEHIKKAIELLDNSLSETVEFTSTPKDKTGKSQLKNAFKVMQLAPSATKFLFVFDCDVDIADLNDTSNYFAYAFNNNENGKAKKGIENLYPDELFSETHYPEKTEIDDYGASKKIQEFDKNAFLATIIADTNVEDFSNFKPLLDKIRTILGINVDAAGGV
jgi:predicted ATPase